MNKQVVKFLEFKGKNIVYMSVDGTYWIAIKPVCEAISVNFNRQYQNIKSDPILSSEFAKQQIQIPGKQARYYACLPEEFIYGWIFSIRSESKELERYKRECYHVLYNHFHGIITRRRLLIKEKADTALKRRKVEQTLLQNSEYIELTKLRAQERSIGRKLKEIECCEVEEASDLFNQK